MTAKVAFFLTFCLPASLLALLEGKASTNIDPKIVLFESLMYGLSVCRVIAWKTAAMRAKVVFVLWGRTFDSPVTSLCREAR
jgi:hypothetical protein